MKTYKADTELPIDPLVLALTPKMVEKAVSEYTDLLDAKKSEESIHEFLASHSYFFNGLLRMFGYSPLFSKLKFGCNYEVDFAWFDTSSLGPEWHLAEIEAPTVDLFTKSGDPSAKLTHAMAQVRNWHAWIHADLNYARKLMPYIEYPLGHVFMGRRRNLSSDDKKALRRLEHENRQNLRIHTLDWFADGGRSVLDLMNGDRGGWLVPMHALGHSDLANGFSTRVQTWMEYASHDPYGWNKRQRTDQRDFGYHKLSEFREENE